MTKYVSKNDGCHLSSYHNDPECVLMKKQSRKAPEKYIQYHELEPCWRCAGGERPENSNPDMRYQNASIDENNDPLDRLHD